jgi:predicted Fe-Mo cluster-binding NifX family protein
LPFNKDIIIAVAIVKPDNTSFLSEVFGRSKYFLISSLKDNFSEIYRNPFASELGDAGIQSARFLIEKNIDVLIVKKIGMNPFRFLTSANIKVYLGKKGSSIEAIQLFTEGKLIFIENIKRDFSFGSK